MKSPSEEGETAPGSFTGVGPPLLAPLLLLLALLPSAAALSVGGGVEAEEAPAHRTVGW